MNDNPEVIYFELNNWNCGRDYPDAHPYFDWMNDDLKQQFQNEKWVKKNKLCVVETYLDMSCNYLITATKEWVENTCPTLLEKYKKFIRYPDEEGNVYGKNVDCKFLEYSEDNIGHHFYRDVWVDGYLQYIPED